MENCERAEKRADERSSSLWIYDKSYNLIAMIGNGYSELKLWSSDTCAILPL
jgi:hypothetical protein